MSVVYEYDEEAKYLLTRFWGVVPKMIFVDPEGVIVDEEYTLRGERLDALLSKHLDEN
jgi:hypothetical protein